MTEKNKRFLESFFTPLDEAVTEIKKRRENTDLVKKVEDFLNSDVPEHFAGEKPIMYLSRHLATPNYEAMRFIELGRKYDLPLVIGQDSKGIFVGNNELKRSLGKLPVTKGVSHNLDEIIEYFTMVDFSDAQGKPICEINTKSGKSLIEFHNNLMKEIYPKEVIIAEESDWVDRNFRNDLKEQYKRMLALLCVHGVMFESYPESELDFVKTILKPTFEEIEEKFSVRPLIVEHINDELECQRDWNSYPSIFYQFIKKEIDDAK